MHCLLYAEKIETEVTFICNEIIDILDKYLIPYAQRVEYKVSLHKMRSDYYRYLCEITESGTELNKTYRTEMQKSDEKSMEIMNTEMAPAHPTRLGMALSYATFYYELGNDPQKALTIAKNAFDDAIEELDSLPEDDYNDSALIMQLLRDLVNEISSPELQGDDQMVE
jgi:hypothetical protein